MIYYSLYMFFAIKSFFSKYYLAISFASLLVLIPFSGLRGVDVDRDYLNYYYLWFKSYNDLQNIYFEPLSKLIFAFFYDMNFEFYWVLIFFTALSIFFKIFTVVKLRLDLGIFILIYLGYFYFQHDMTQIRLAAALGIYYLSFLYQNENRVISFFIFLLSMMFHSSTIILLLGRYPIYKKNGYLIVVAIICVISYILYFLRFDLSSIIRTIVLNIPYFDKYLFYFSSSWSDQSINVLSFTNISFIMITLFSLVILVKYKCDDYYFRSAIFYTLLGLTVIPLFSFIPVLSFRLSQVYLIFFPMVCAFIYKTISERIQLNNEGIILIRFFLRLAFITYGALLLYGVIFSAKILNPYEMIL